VVVAWSAGLGMRLLAASVLCLAVQLPASAAAADEPVLALRVAMVDRLTLMPDVARHKWNAGAAVADPPREEAVIAAAIAAGRDAGLGAEAVESAIRAQVDAARLVQAMLFDRWKGAGEGPFMEVPDLATVLRPRISAATAAVVDGLAGALPALAACAGASALREYPDALAGFEAAWDRAADGIIAAAGGPPPEACPRWAAVSALGWRRDAGVRLEEFRQERLSCHPC